MPERFIIRRAIRKLLRPLTQRTYQDPGSMSPEDIPGPVLFLLAHPDDEVFCSGLILHLHHLGIPAHILCFTRGEGGTRGHLPDDCDLAAEREREMRESAAILKATSVSFLDYEDPPPPPGKLYTPPIDNETFQRQIAGHVERHAIRLLVSHGSSGEYWHPAHLALHQQAKTFAASHLGLEFWTMNAWVPEHPLDSVINQDDKADLWLDTRIYEESRIKALAAHKSQTEVFETFVGGSIRDYIRHTRIEAYRRVQA